ncbi:hypothetical protein ACVR1N_02225 [Streptococcus constellatus subsp. pharyngis]|uniref:Uncharacterized protein n=2 Tax=Streptococcus TaxID=1301 RepID=A0A3S9MRE8_9STRE|nr:MULTISPECIES: hypothetical protein [Streptococcus]AGU72699.1 hypothetical protein SCRE_0857 [Streptococcus constellatus subsp. pharyngis C232]AGU74455.1 hypothetical protein SCR2_0857 [Streptococcus constellatus subsp. pharyngis C818]AGU79872.1 hypothetical protein SCI_0929 [Streptococcus constellatus subsp. pharyngis C1050]AZQ41744.1 hypothetical protein EHW89_04425 [Streptococcus periodonticum]QRP82132.1 hypothetical protein I6J38_02325 [Streptococcus constellatus]
MKYQKIVTGASLLGLITFLLPVVSGGGYSLTPMSSAVANYLGAPSTLLLFVLWYGAFVATFLLSLVTSKSIVFSKIQFGLILLLNVYAIFIQLSITGELLGHSGSLGFGGILYYLCAAASFFAGVMLFKEEGFRINQEDLKKVAKKSIAFGKTTAKVATKVTQTAVSEVKKEIDNHKLNSKK